MWTQAQVERIGELVGVDRDSVLFQKAKDGDPTLVEEMRRYLKRWPDAQTLLDRLSMPCDGGEPVFDVLGAKEFFAELQLRVDLARLLGELEESSMYKAWTMPN